jgi:hypothetical protein
VGRRREGHLEARRANAKGLQVLGEDEGPEPQAVESSPTERPAVDPVGAATAGAEAVAAPEITEIPPETPPAPPTATTAEPSPAAPDGGSEPARSKPAKRSLPAAAKPGKPSALDAAARVLQEAGRPMTCPEMIAAMAERGYWSSAGGKTPAATLYSAILRELQTKPGTSRFIKTARGKFARTGAV